MSALSVTGWAPWSCLRWLQTGMLFSLPSLCACKLKGHVVPMLNAQYHCCMLLLDVAAPRLLGFQHLDNHLA